MFFFTKKVGMISLGCAKNLVDAEIMLGSVRAQGMEITANAEEADVLIVNTCAFIDSAISTVHEIEAAIGQLSCQELAAFRGMVPT